MGFGGQLQVGQKDGRCLAGGFPSAIFSLQLEQLFPLPPRLCVNVLYPKDEKYLFSRSLRSSV